MSTKGHRDEKDCDCGLCEPAVGGNIMGSILAGNPGCDFPNCVILGVTCAWGPEPCFNISEYSDRAREEGS